MEGVAGGGNESLARSGEMERKREGQRPRYTRRGQGRTEPEERGGEKRSDEVSPLKPSRFSEPGEQMRRNRTAGISWKCLNNNKKAEKKNKIK